MNVIIALKSELLTKSSEMWQTVFIFQMFKKKSNLFHFVNS